jgi:hypothetical protein
VRADAESDAPGAHRTCHANAVTIRSFRGNIFRDCNFRQRRQVRTTRAMSLNSDTDAKRFIAEAMVPLHKRIAALEQRIVDLETKNASVKSVIVRFK